MKCISVQQPWSWAIIHGEKRVENRTWATRHRGPLLIHAGKSRVRLGDYGPGEPPPEQLVFGAIIGVVQVIACTSEVDPMDRFSEGPFCWLLADPRAFAPIPYRGQQGLFDVPDEVVRKALAAADRRIQTTP